MNVWTFYIACRYLVPHPRKDVFQFRNMVWQVDRQWIIYTHTHTENVLQQSNTEHEIRNKNLMIYKYAILLTCDIRSTLRSCQHFLVTLTRVNYLLLIQFNLFRSWIRTHSKIKVVLTQQMKKVIFATIMWIDFEMKCDMRVNVLHSDAKGSRCSLRRLSDVISSQFSSKFVPTFDFRYSFHCI